MTRKISLASIIWLIGMIGCGYSQERADRSPAGYDLTQPEKSVLPGSLFEVSGIAFRAGNADTVYAIQDEDGILFRMAWNERKAGRVRFAGRGDYEDLAILDDRVFVLKSNGDLYSFPFLDKNKPEIAAEKSDKLLPKGEYEALYGDAERGRLYVLCKNCRRDEDKNRVSGYVLSTRQGLKEVGEFNLDTKEIKTYLGKMKRGFQPSALARNPVSGEWYILSSMNRALLIADSSWRVKDAFALRGSDFLQPEGIAFDRAGNLYISNEGDKLSGGTILKFVRKE